MATSSTPKYSRPTTFVVRRVAGKESVSSFRPVQATPQQCEPMRMTNQEAEVFFAACETPVRAETDIFEYLPEVAQWFQD